MKTIVEQNAELLARAESAEKALKAEQEKGAGLEKALADARGELAKLAEADVALNAQHAEEIKAMTAAAAKAVEERDAEKALREKAEKALANPAFAQAAAKTATTATEEGGAPSGEKPMTKDEALRQYNALPDGMEGARARADFRAKHAAILGL